MFYNYFLLLFFLLISYYIYKTYKIEFIFLFFTLFGMFTVLASNTYIEAANPYIMEEGIYGFYTGSTIRYFIYSMFGISSFILMFNILKTLAKFPVYSIQHIDRNIDSKIIIFSFVLITILIFHALVSNPPLFNPASSRFNFWSDFAKIPSFSKFNVLVLMLLPTLSIMVVTTKSLSKKNIIYFFVVLLIFYDILLGNKFSSIILKLVLFFVPMIVIKLLAKEKILNLKIISFLLIFSFFILILIINEYGTEYDILMQKIISRVLILQGHTWWGSDYYVYQHGGLGTIDQLWNEILSIISQPEPMQAKAGMPYMMNLIGHNEVYTYFEAGVQYTMGFPAILVIIFGWYYVFFPLLLVWFIFSFIYFYYYYLIISSSRIRIFLFSHIIITSGSFWSNGTLHTFFNFKLLVIIFCLIILEMYKSYKRKKEVFV